MELEPEQVELLRLAGSLHDLGKLAIPEEVLRKPGPLTEAERLVLERHPQIGYRMLDSLGVDPSPTGFSTTTSAGTARGIPTASAENDIPLGARILFVADAYDAMTTDRVYRGRLSHYRALTELERCSGTQFDPNVVEAFKVEFAAADELESLERASRRSQIAWIVRCPLALARRSERDVAVLARRAGSRFESAVTRALQSTGRVRRGSITSST